VLNITSYSDLIILRDIKSKENLEEIFKDFNKCFADDFIFTSYDPAVECALEYNSVYKSEPKEYIAVNLRKFPLEYSRNKDNKSINIELKKFIKSLSEKYENRIIKLIPMHYFHIGGDDRIFLNEIALDLRLNNIKVQNPNLTLKETIEVYQNAYFCVGMRFHSVVLQTIVNGKNYILDYTEPKKGKIYGFIQDIDKINFYKNRYISLQKDTITTDIIKNCSDCFIYDFNDIQNKLGIYVNKLKELV